MDHNEKNTLGNDPWNAQNPDTQNPAVQPISEQPLTEQPIEESLMEEQPTADQPVPEQTQTSEATWSSESPMMTSTTTIDGMINNAIQAKASSGNTNYQEQYTNFEPQPQNQYLGADPGSQNQYSGTDPGSQNQYSGVDPGSQNQYSGADSNPHQGQFTNPYAESYQQNAGNTNYSYNSSNSGYNENYNNNYNNSGSYNSYNQAPQDPNSEVMSLGDWLLTIFIGMIPCVNIIMFFVWGFSSNTNLNRKNYCRAYLIFMGIGIVLYFLWIVLWGMTMWHYF